MKEEEKILWSGHSVLSEISIPRMSLDILNSKIFGILDIIHPSKAQKWKFKDENKKNK